MTTKAEEFWNTYMRNRPNAPGCQVLEAYRQQVLQDVLYEIDRYVETFTEDSYGKTLPLGFRPRTIEEIKTAIRTMAVT